MVPFDSLVPSLRRTVRQAAQEVGKRAQLKVEGAQGEMDRNLLERMKAPFEHMLRNAVVHGIEKPTARAAVLLRYGQELRYDDVAVIASARSSTIQRRVSRALPVLRKCLDRKSRGGVR